MGLDPAQVDALVKSIHCLMTDTSVLCGNSMAFPVAATAQADAQGCLAAVEAHRISSLMDNHATQLDLPEPIAAELHSMAMNEAMLALALAKETVHAWNALASAGVAALAFKGVALSVQTTGSLTARGNGDIDLLVRPADVLGAVQVLTAAGWQLAEISARRLERDWRWLQWGGRELVMVGPRSQIDVHWQVAKERGLLPPAETLLERATEVEILGEHIATFGYGDSLLAACYHLNHDGFRSLRQCVDVIRLLQLQEHPVHWTGRDQRVGFEAANFAVQLLGGVTQERLEAMGIPQRATPLAHRRWAQLSCHPEYGHRSPGVRGLWDRIVDNTRHGSTITEFARRGAVRMATRKRADI